MFSKLEASVSEQDFHYKELFMNFKFWRRRVEEVKKICGSGYWTIRNFI